MPLILNKHILAT